MSDKQTVCFWPDGQWCDLEDIEQYAWKSDDYAMLTVPVEFNYGDIDATVSDLVNGGNHET